MVRKIEQFEASDGAIFDSRAKAEAHEARIKPLSPFAKFWEKTYGGDALRKAGHTLESVGVWRIEGEGPVDFGSTGAAPHIATVSGTLRKAIEFAVTALDAWQAYQVDSALYEMEQAHKRLDEALRRLQEQQNEGEPFSTDEAEREMGI